MADALDSREVLREDLMDAGCGKCLMDACLSLSGEGSREKLLLVLKNHRGELIKKMHQSQREIDHLDFLMYRLRKGSAASNGSFWEEKE